MTGEVRVDWEFSDGSCNWAIADDREVARLKLAQLQRDAERMGTAVRVWFGGEIAARGWIAADEED